MAKDGGAACSERSQADAQATDRQGPYTNENQG